MSKGKIAGKAPLMVDFEEGKVYAWCTCGLSDKQPYCNGAHQGSDFSPLIINAEKDSKVALCTCKQTNNPPYCDGAHSKC